MNVRSINCLDIRDTGRPLRHIAGAGELFFLYCRSRAILATPAGQSSLPEATAVLFGKGQQCDVSAAEGALVCDWISFEAGSDAEFAESLELPLGQPFRFTDADFIEGLVRNIAEEFYSLRTRRLKIMDSLLRTLLIKLYDSGTVRDVPQLASDPHYSSLIDLRAKIYRNPQQKWNVDTMAADVNMSRSYFQHIYREFFGVSCITDVINGKIEKAKEILSETNCTVSQVAAMCGYENRQHQHQP